MSSMFYMMFINTYTTVKITREIFSGILADLESKGFLENFSGSFTRRVTDLAIPFIKFISDPESNIE